MNSGGASPYRRRKIDVMFGGSGSGGFEDYESVSDPFDIVSTKSAPVDRLKRWRQAALVLNSSRRFRYTIDLKKEEEKKQIIAKIRTRAQVIRAAFLFRAQVIRAAFLFQAAGANPNAGASERTRKRGSARARARVGDGEENSHDGSGDQLAGSGGGDQAAGSGSVDQASGSGSVDQAACSGSGGDQTTGGGGDQAAGGGGDQTANEEERRKFSIHKQLDESLVMYEDTGNSIYILIPENSRFHSLLKLYDRSNTLITTLKGKIFTARNTWKATGPSGGVRFIVRNKLRFKSDSDLIVKASIGNDFNYTIRGSRTYRSFLIYRGSSPQVVSKVVQDPSDMNKYFVEIDPMEDSDIFREIVFSVTAIVDAVARARASGEGNVTATNGLSSLNSLCSLGNLLANVLG